MKVTIEEHVFKKMMSRILKNCSRPEQKKNILRLFALFTQKNQTPVYFPKKLEKCIGLIGLFFARSEPFFKRSDRNNLARTIGIFHPRFSVSLCWTFVGPKKNPAPFFRVRPHNNIPARLWTYFCQIKCQVVSDIVYVSTNHCLQHVRFFLQYNQEICVGSDHYA